MNPGNPFQRGRQTNIDFTLRAVAKAMPGGADNTKLLAVLQMQGFSKRAANDYLNVLRDLGRIEYSSEDQKWRIVK